MTERGRRQGRAVDGDHPRAERAAADETQALLDADLTADGGFAAWTTACQLAGVAQAYADVDALALTTARSAA